MEFLKFSIFLLSKWMKGAHKANFHHSNKLLQTWWQLVSTKGQIFATFAVSRWNTCRITVQNNDSSNILVWFTK
jgi:hypothetical protein